MVVSSATLGDEERTILDEVFAVGEKSLREVMVPRTEVDFLQGSMKAVQGAQVVRDGSHSRYPVIDGSADRVLGLSTSVTCSSSIPSSVTAGCPSSCAPSSPCPTP